MKTKISKGALPEAKEGIVVSWGRIPLNVHPHQVNDLDSYRIITHVYEGLVRRGPGDVLLPGIAKSIEISEDQKEYRFHLRESYWSDGTPLVAEDFVRSWKLAIDEGSSDFRIAACFDLLKGPPEYSRQSIDQVHSCIVAETSHILRINLYRPITHFLQLLTLPAFMPVHPRHDLQKPITNGPFKIGAANRAPSLILEKNFYFWDQDSVHLPQITLVSIEKEEKCLSFFENERVHFIGYGAFPLSDKAIERLDKTGLMSCAYETTGQVQIWINTQKGPFSSESIRQAFSMAIDRETLASEHSMLYSPARGYLPLTMKSETASSLIKMEINEARQLMRESLEELQMPFSAIEKIQLLVPRHLAPLGKILQQQWLDHLRVLVEIKVLDSSEQFSHMQTGNFDIALDSFFAAFDDAYAFFPFNLQNYTGWSPNYFQLLFEEGLSLMGQERSDHIEQMEEYILAAMPIIPLLSRREMYGMSPHLKGVFIGKCFDLDFSRAYWE